MTVLEAFFDRFSDGVCVSGRDGAILYLNAAAKRLLSAPAAGGLDACELICGALFGEDAKARSAGCSLRGEGSEERHIAFSGEHGRKAVFEWTGTGVKRAERSSRLRVRCLKLDAAPPGLGDEACYFTLIEEVGSER